MVTQSYDLNLIPGYGSVPVVAHASQYDSGARTLVFNLLDGDAAFTPVPGTAAVVEGTKPDGKGFSYAATVSGSEVAVDVTEQMTAAAGNVRCELRLTDATGTAGTANFILAVERAGLDGGTDISETEIPAIVDAARGSAAAAAKSAAEAAGSASSAESSATAATTKASEASSSASSASTAASTATAKAAEASSSASSAGQSASTATAKASEASASATAAAASASTAKEEADRAFSGTPEGYEEIAEAVKDVSLSQFSVKNGALHLTVPAE